MLRFFSALFACWVLCLSVCAVYDVRSDADLEALYPLGSSVGSLADLSSPALSDNQAVSQGSEMSGSPDMVTDDVVLTGVARVSVPPVTPSSTSGLKAALLTVLGNYDPVVVVYQYQTSGSGYSSYATDIQPDYAWLASAALLCLVIWCLFKLGGALLRG